MGKNELRIEHLCKKYHKTETALNDFSYTFTDGIYGLLGPNGAGKTTLMNIITSNIQETSGKILYNGREFSNGEENIRKDRIYASKPKCISGVYLGKVFILYVCPERSG